MLLKLHYQLLTYTVLFFHQKDMSVQAQFLIPMAVSLGFGILFATFIILIGVPAGMKSLDMVLSQVERRRSPDPEAPLGVEPAI